MTRRGFASLISLTMMFVALSTGPAHATVWEKWGNYRTYGFHWMARFDGPDLYFVSTDCKTAELTFASQATSSSLNQTYFQDYWPYGIAWWRPQVGYAYPHNDPNAECKHQIGPDDDMKLNYLENTAWVNKYGSQTGDGNFGGKTLQVRARERYCDVWNIDYPCGYHGTVIDINEYKWNNRGSSWRTRLILHEMGGHGLGLMHHCGHASIMNTGKSGCTVGTWEDIQGYTVPNDRHTIKSMYPNFPYQN